MTDMYTLQDPTEQYPLPPFKRQTQKAPGMAKKMVPKPDHGELRYGGLDDCLRERRGLLVEIRGLGVRWRLRFRAKEADVAINYLPSEEADAKEVIELIEQAGRKAVAIPAIYGCAFAQDDASSASRQWFVRLHYAFHADTDQPRSRHFADVFCCSRSWQPGTGC